MQTTTPKITNMAPITGRMVNEENEIHNVVDDYGMLKTINPEAVYVHDGRAFNFSFVGSISGVTYLLGRTNGKVVHLLGYHLQAASNAVLVEFFEAPTVTNAGTAQTVIARNRVNPQEAHLTVFSGTTVSADGLLLNKSKIFASGQGSNKVGGDTTIPIEWLLKPNTDYVFKLTPGGTTEVTADFTWVETED
jgi:hypothetical protein